MRKEDVREAIRELANRTGQSVHMRLVGPLANLTGEWRVVGTRTGRGRNGSLLVDLVNDESDTTLETTLGTPNAEDLVSIKVGEMFFGSEEVGDTVGSYEPDLSRASALKEEFTQFLTPEAEGKTLKVESTEHELNGGYQLVSARKSRGRYGPILLNVRNTSTGEHRVINSYRHSGVITRVLVNGEL